MVPKTALVPERGHENRVRQIRCILWTCPRADDPEQWTRNETIANGGAFHSDQESLPSFTAPCHSGAHDERHLSGNTLQLYSNFRISDSVRPTQVVSFDGSTTIEEFHSTLASEIGCRESTNGFCLFSDDPIEKDLEHYLDPQAKLCDVISKWETALREKGSGKFENSRVIQLTYKNRLYWKHSIKLETDKEKLLLCYQTNIQIVQGRFPLSRDLALELTSLMAQIDIGDYASTEKARATSSLGSGGGGAGGGAQSAALLALDKFYPYRYRDALSPEQLKELQEILISKWILLKTRSTLDCVRIYLTCCRKWPYFGSTLFQAKPRHSDQAMAWLAIAEDALNVLELSSMAPIARYPYSSVMTFGGCQDDFMLVVGAEETPMPTDGSEAKLLFAMSKPKILEITLLIADYMNALGHTCPGTPQMNTLTRNGSHRSIR